MKTGDPVFLFNGLVGVDSFPDLGVLKEPAAGLEDLGFWAVVNLERSHVVSQCKHWDENRDAGAWDDYFLLPKEWQALKAKAEQEKEEQNV